MSGGLHPRAQIGFAKASNYDQHRPSYPPETVDALLENVRVKGKRGAKVVDLAAGTGKFTELLAKREEGYEITAVEPQKDMRQVLEDKKLPGLRVVDGLSTSIPVDDGGVDAVICAQSFHWFANMESLREMHRVLQPHGALGMVWNIEDYNAPQSHKATTPWEQKMQDKVMSLDDTQPRFRHEKWHQVFDDQLSNGPLSLLVAADPLFALPLGAHEQRWAVWLPKDKIWERLTTLSQIATLEGEEREEVHRYFLDAINAADVEVNERGEVAVNGGTILRWTTKVPAAGASKLWEKQS